MSKTYFHGVDPIRYEGPQSHNPLAFRWYDKDRMVLGKRMEEQLRFAVCYWHSFSWNGFDPFGYDGTFERPWQHMADPMAAAHAKADAAFDFFSKLGAPYYCFHDRDVAPEGSSPRESANHLRAMVDVLAAKQEASGIRLLWGTANLFSHRRFMAGAATNPDPEIFALAALQVKEAMDATLKLGGANYVLWGGREGYETLLNTRMGQELDQMGRFLHMVVDYKHKIGFKGTILLEPKPREPSKHQYDFDVANCVAFLRGYGLADSFKLNVETNHATLAGHTMMHELAYASMCGMLGSIDANRGDLLLGWDTDQFPTDYYLTTQCMLVILGQGGLANEKGGGGVNFDAKVRRESFEPIDLFHAHIGGMDAFAVGLKLAAQIRKEGVLSDFVKQRYASWDTGIGAKVEAGQAKFEDLETYMLEKGDAAKNVSGRQEMLENIINRYVR